ncbi:MAG TPA: hypothetical protein PLF22_13125 [Pseudomonadales bacterium]|nr:hypothetical protein [Pseudomonadales bacterium]
MSNTAAARSESRRNVESLLGQHIAINHHVVLAEQLSQADAEQLTPADVALYVESLAWVLPETLEISQRSYLHSLCRLLDYVPGASHIEALADNADKVPVENLLAILGRPALRSAWILDACMLACDEGELDSESSRTMIRVARATGLSMPAAKKLVHSATVLAIQEDTDALVDAIGSLGSDAWRTALVFRGLNFTSAFRQLEVELGCSFEGTRIMSDICKLQTGSLLNGMEVVDSTSLLNKVGVKLMRHLSVSDFSGLQKRTEAFAESSEKLCDEARRIIHAFGGTTDHHLEHLYFLEPDRNTALDNEAWHKNMDDGLEKMTRFIQKQESVMYRLSESLGYIGAGDWDSLQTSATKEEGSDDSGDPSTTVQ